MATKKTILKFDMELETEERVGYFATRTTPFAITTYGGTVEEAEQRGTQAVLLLMKRYTETPSKLSDFLTHRGVKHVILENMEGMGRRFPLVRSCRTEMRVEVPVGG